MEKDLTKIINYLRRYPEEALKIADNLNSWNGSLEWARTFERDDINDFFDSPLDFMNKACKDIDLNAQYFRSTDYGIESIEMNDLIEEVKDRADEIAEELMRNPSQVEDISGQLAKLMQEFGTETNKYSVTSKESTRKITFVTDKGNKWATVILCLTTRNGYDEFTACGDFNGSYGQCLDSITEYMNLEHKFSDGLTWGTIYEWWEKYHCKKVEGEVFEKMKKVIFEH